MPVCKFFLQGLCVRDDCPYLHKKLNEKAQICLEFQRGFCELADKVSYFGGAILFQEFLFSKCDKKHENLVLPRTTKVRKVIKTKSIKPVIPEELVKEKEVCRYFGDEDLTLERESATTAETEDFNESSGTDIEDDSIECKVLKRPKLGVLPAFIPL